MLCILINIVFISLSYDTSTHDYRNFLENMNDIFTFIFLTEAIFKIAGLGFGGYW